MSDAIGVEDGAERLSPSGAVIVARGDRESARKPYKGLDSYQVEDAALFYGRDRDAEQLIAKILSARLTVLHAQSGAGKTSLLNARIIPGLESAGWSAARVIPQNDPVQSVSTTTLLHLLPPPEAERLAIQTAWVSQGTPDTVGELLRAYDALAPGDPARRELIAPLEVTALLPWSGPAAVRSYPWFTRLLRGTVGLPRFSQHLSAFSAMARCGSTPPIDADTPISLVVQVLTELNGAYLATLEQLLTADRDLEGIFSRVMTQYQAALPDLGVVVLFDQAEELFTRFVDQPTRDGTLDWRLKWEFFEQLERLVGRSSATGSPLPIRFVISMRSEYLGQLDPVRSFAWELDASSYHLGMLATTEAMHAITKPAETFGRSYTADCSARIVGELAREERYVEPAQLQIVCDELWRAHRDEGGIQIGVEELQALGGSRGIVGAFLEKVIGTLEPDERLETLELLEPLVTRSGTRNVASRDSLAEQQFRDVPRRNLLLQRLIATRIVREERRLGGTFVELTHEFLINPVLTLLEQLSADAGYSRFRWALATLQQLAQTGQSPRAAGALRIGEFLALHDNRARIVLDDWVREVMLRSAIALAHVIPTYRKPREIVGVWTSQLAGMIRPAPELAAVLAAVRDRRPLDARELRTLNAARDTLSLTPNDVAHVLRSELAAAIDAERADVQYWTRRAWHEQRTT